MVSRVSAAFVRVTVGTIVGLVAAGKPPSDILTLYPYLEEDDIREALAYAAWRVEEVEVPVRHPARTASV